METTSVLLSITLLLMASAFFSGAEVALFSIDKKNIDRTLVRSPFLLKKLNHLLEFPRRLLITILIGNTLVNILLSILTAYFAIQIAEHYGWVKDIVITLQIVIVTLVILIFGEVTPKLLSSRNPLHYAKLYTIPLYVISVFLYPIAEILTEMMKVLVSKLSVHSKFHTLSNDEIPFLAKLGHEKGTIEEDEHDLIQGLVSTKTKVVKEIMIHRTEIFAVPINIPFEELVVSLRSALHSRIPVFEESLDNIKGVLYAKDLLKYLHRSTNDNSFSLMKILRKPLIVPETKLINELMKEFQENKLHVAIVVDEYGGTAGLVTLEDIIEEVVGEISDEFDTEDEFVKMISETSFLVNGGMPIREFAEQFGIAINFNSIEYETAAGWIYEEMGKIPTCGDNFQRADNKITITEMDNSRIKFFTFEKSL